MMERKRLCADRRSKGVRCVGQCYECLHNIDFYLLIIFSILSITESPRALFTSI